MDFEGSLPYEAVSDLDSVLDSLGENASSPGLLFEEAGDRRRFLVIRVGVIDAQPIDHKDLNEIV
ncbi:hypothetical protein [Thioalkalivibrio thiocyanodenitrificans]|uniref:hypothetical protein n=1 Tax=Thioalkalivibrio thiocyanodenitrificans TaxID=243063 RepID=UPI00038172F7|nr:hypothetical protein [Thioalkalivibrio thiocyanodenitrificans]